MANTVEINVVAKDMATKVMDSIKAALKGVGGVIGELGPIAIGAGVAVVGAMVAMAKQAADYAQEVQHVQQVSGETAEGASKLLNVFNTLGVSTTNLDMVTRTMTKNGLEPSLMTIAVLSDKYLALNTAQERNDFIIKNLGQSGLKWADMLSKGSDELIKVYENTQKGLILSERQIAAADENAKSTAELTQVWKAYRIEIGNSVIPAETALLKAMLDRVEANRISIEQTGHGLSLWTRQGQEFLNIAIQERLANEAAREGVNAQNALGGAAGKTTDELKAEADALEAARQAISDHNDSLLGMVESQQSAEESYLKTQKSLEAERTALFAERDKIMFESHGADMEALDEINAKIQENTDAWSANEDKFVKAQYTIMLGYLQMQLAQDGLSASDTQFLLDQGVKWGIYKDSVVADMQEAQAGLDAWVQQINTIPEAVDTTVTTDATGMNDVINGYSAALGSIPTNITTYLSVATGGQFGPGFYASGGIVGAASGGMRGRDIVAGELGPERITLPQGSYVHTAGESARMGGGMVLNLTYAPVFSTASQADVERMMPVIAEGVRREMKNRGR